MYSLGFGLLGGELSYAFELYFFIVYLFFFVQISL